MISTCDTNRIATENEIKAVNTPSQHEAFFTHKVNFQQASRLYEVSVCVHHIDRFVLIMRL